MCGRARGARPQQIGQTVRDHALVCVPVPCRGWDVPTGDTRPYAYMRRYCEQQAQLCVECQKPTRHRFKLLGCRLCTACETSVSDAHLRCITKGTQRRTHTCTRMDTHTCTHMWAVRKCAVKLDWRLHVLQTHTAKGQRCVCVCVCVHMQHPRYALVTALEAQQRYGLPVTMLSQLPYVESCGVKLWLRDTGTDTHTHTHTHLCRNPTS